MGLAQYHPPTKDQRIRACRVLLSAIGYERLWTAHGPNPEAVHILQQYGGPMGNEEWIIFQVAWTVWGRETGVRLNEILRLSQTRLEMITTLLQAMMGGAESLETWLRRHRPSAPDTPKGSVGKSATLN